ncbi:zinc finger and SCAN domain-containing protein 4-like [Watersipora subatra]|uniref:zinc finger and SCAN domain-containing protein 4-like n=1 Tax=Watersipora subatra TaxID=2589382 RepID=UPI00355B5E0D
MTSLISDYRYEKFLLEDFSTIYNLYYKYWQKSYNKDSEELREFLPEQKSDDEPLDLSKNSGQKAAETLTFSPAYRVGKCIAATPLDLTIKRQESTTTLSTFSQSPMTMYRDCMNTSVKTCCTAAATDVGLGGSATNTANIVQGRTKLYKCEACGKNYKQVRDYRAHVAAHKNTTLFTCDICDCILSTSSDYLLHLKTHNRKDLHTCLHCDRYFRDGYTLTTHVRTHTGEKPYRCAVCFKSFRQIGTYHRHKKVHKVLFT